MNRRRQRPTADQIVNLLQREQEQLHAQFRVAALGLFGSSVHGEAANHIAPQFRSQYPSVPWQEIIGMRNVVVHGYFGVDTTVIWRTVQEDIPPLRKQIEQILLDIVNTEE